MKGLLSTLLCIYPFTALAQQPIMLPYDEISSFYQGHAIVSQGGKTGIINKQGKLIFPLTNYSRIRFEENGYYSFESDKGYGLLDSMGHVIIPDKCKGWIEFYASDAIICPGASYSFSVMDLKGNEIVPKHQYKYITSAFTQDASARVQSFDFKFGMIDSKGKEIFPVIYDNIEALQPGYYSLKKGEQWALFNLKGEQLTPFKYTNIHSTALGDNFFVAEDNHDKHKEGIIDINGKEVIPIQFFRVNSVTDGIVDLIGYEIFSAPYNQSFILNQDLKKIHVLGDYGSATPFIYNDQWLSVSVYKNAGVMTKSGKIIIPLTSKIIILDGDFYVVLAENNKYALYNKKGEPLLPAQYQYLQASISLPSKDGINYVEWRKTDKQGLVDTAKHIYDLSQYEAFLPLQSKLFAVYQNKSWGAVNEKGEVVIPFEYGSLKPLSYNHFFFKEKSTIFNHNEKYGIIDLDQNVLQEPSYTEIEYTKVDNLGIITDATGKKAFFNRDNGRIGDIQYTNIEVYPYSTDHDDQTYFIITDENKKGLADGSGNVIVPPIYNTSLSMNTEFFFDGDWVKVKNIHGWLAYYDFSGNPIFARK